MKVIPRIQGNINMLYKNTWLVLSQNNIETYVKEKRQKDGNNNNNNNDNEW